MVVAWPHHMSFITISLTPMVSKTARQHNPDYFSRLLLMYMSAPN
ncbi:hypothetical protein HPTD01_3138 [Halomonas sp. TD01]|nr:hypothetical protein HPTD01_3138 [Halomonas sp. TD01]